MKYKPHNYQQFATDFILNQSICCLMLDMGLGKTVITLTALWQLALDSFDVSRVLVIAPKRVAEDHGRRNWQNGNTSPALPPPWSWVLQQNGKPPCRRKHFCISSTVKMWHGW